MQGKSPLVMGIMNPRRIVPSGHEEELARGSAAASVFTPADEQPKSVTRGKIKMSLNINTSAVRTTTWAYLVSAGK